MSELLGNPPVAAVTLPPRQGPLGVLLGTDLDTGAAQLGSELVVYGVDDHAVAAQLRRWQATMSPHRPPGRRWR